MLCNICAKRFMNEDRPSSIGKQMMEGSIATFADKTFVRPVEADAKHAVLSQGSKEQFIVFPALPILGEGALHQRDLADSVM